jgi:hypothetical protein
MTEQVVTTNGITTTNYVPNPYAVVTQGQLKQFTARAVDNLNSNLTGGAGTNLNNLVQGWAQDYATNNYSNPTNAYAPYNPRDFNAMTVGQLKYVGNMVWTQLVAVGYTNALPAWLGTNTTDTQLANLGQLKQVFNFDLSGAESANTITGLTATFNSDGSVTLSWINSGSGGGSVVIGGLDANGNWDSIETLSSTATSVTLTADQMAGFSALGASNALINALGSMAISAVQNPGYVPPRYAVIDLGAGIDPIALSNGGYVVSTNPSDTAGYRWFNGATQTLTSCDIPVGVDDAGTVIGAQPPFPLVSFVTDANV